MVSNLSVSTEREGGGGEGQRCGGKRLLSLTLVFNVGLQHFCQAAEYCRAHPYGRVVGAPSDCFMAALVSTVLKAEPAQAGSGKGSLCPPQILDPRVPLPVLLGGAMTGLTSPPPRAPSSPPPVEVGG